MDQMVRNSIRPALLPACWLTIAAAVHADESASASRSDVRAAATRAVRLIDQTSALYLTKNQCFTCHSQTLSAMVLRDALKLRFEVDEKNFSRQVERSFEVYDSLGKGLRVDTVGHALWALDLGRYPPDAKTASMAADILSRDKERGVWNTTVDRPPAEASKLTTNYLAIRGLNRYGTAEQREEISKRTATVKQWLETAEVADTEDQVFRLRLAAELKLPPETSARFVKRLLDAQAPEGGWAQKADLKPDAYATGSVLVALHEAGGVSCRDPAWRRGLEYLLRTQLPDGSWRVATRAKPLQEFFESGFPHGKDQFISAFATGWAAEALLLALLQDQESPGGAQPAPAAPSRG